MKTTFQLKLLTAGPHQEMMARHNGIIEERLTGENDQLVYYQAVSDFPSFFPLL